MLINVSMNLPLCFIMIFKRFGEKQDLIHVMVDLLVESCFASQNKRYERSLASGRDMGVNF